MHRKSPITGDQSTQHKGTIIMEQQIRWQCPQQSISGS